MTYEGNGDMGLPQKREIPHYHGDGTRALFVICALILIIAKSTGADLPLSTIGTVASAVLLVVAAGVTNPAQTSVHWLNALLSVLGTLVFGITAIRHYRAGMGLLDPSFLYVEILALLSLIALYLTTRTIRGMQIKS